MAASFGGHSPTSLGRWAALRPFKPSPPPMAPFSTTHFNDYASLNFTLRTLYPASIHLLLYLNTTPLALLAQADSVPRRFILRSTLGSIALCSYSQHFDETPYL
jgi:hypothetical protein